MKILYIGGSGQISFDCVLQSIKEGNEVWVYNRGNKNENFPSEVNFIKGDFFNDEEYSQILSHDFDIICQFRIFNPEEMKRDLKLFARLSGLKQYIFISTCVCYRKKGVKPPLTEDVPRDNILWDYGENKIACEKLLINQTEIPWTIIRPSHTTRDFFITALSEHDNVAFRILNKKPVIIFNDGNSKWTITLARHFAIPFVNLFGNNKAIRNDFTLTSDNYYTWNEIYHSLGKALGKKPEITYVPAEKLVDYDPKMKGPLLGDKINDTYFDNTKIKSVAGDFKCDISLDDFMKEIVGLFYKRKGKVRIDPRVDEEYDKMIKALS